jgi:hypothetical protein
VYDWKEWVRSEHIEEAPFILEQRVGNNLITR